jgi:DNA-binding transcriptional MocR family regulator
MNVTVQYAARGRTAQAICESVEAMIAAGAVAPGDPLLPVRRLAGELGVSPNTVAAAYRTLSERGLVVADGRRGTRVASRPPVLSGFTAAVPDGLVDLASGNPDSALLPPLPVLAPRVAATPTTVDLPDLIRLARSRFAESAIETGDLLVLGGALDAIERVLTARLRPGDRVIVEDPGFAPLADLLRALHLVPVPVPVDDRGLLPSAIAEALGGSGAGAVVLTPRAQNPTGAALDRARTDELTTVIAGHPRVVVIEDDHAGPVAGAPAASVCAGLLANPWAVVASVSKWLGPDMRVALLAGDSETAARVAGRRSVGAGWVSTVLQQLVVDLWADRDVMDRVAAAAAEYQRRRGAVIDALAAEGIASTGRSGLNVWVPLPHEAPAVAACREAGLAIAPGERFRLRSGPGVRISIGRLVDEHLPVLAAAIASATNAAPRTALAR